MEKPPIKLTRRQARRFLLAHHSLLPPRRLDGKQGILQFIEHVGCIQYDPVNVLAQNPDLVLQSRLKNYQAALLDDLLYTDRQLIQGWDKVSSYYLTRDWPFFSPYRIEVEDYFKQRQPEVVEIAPDFLEEIHKRGPLSSLDFKDSTSINWSWGQPTRLARAALEILYETGRIQVHHRVNTRRYFDLIERLVPEKILNTPDPNPDFSSYHDWHVLRRIGSLGLTNSANAEVWLGITAAKSGERRAALKRLISSNQVREVGIDDIPGKTFYLRTKDLPVLEETLSKPAPRSQAALIGVLDNLIWDRKLTNWLFDFEYIWEIYKPADQRQYGYYVLPVLYGDRFVARCDLALDRKTNQLILKNWWWEADVKVSRSMLTALQRCFASFTRFLKADTLVAGPDFLPDEHLQNVL